MQQQSLSWQSLPDRSLGAIFVPHHQPCRRQVGASQHFYHLLAATIGQCQIATIDPIADLRASAERASTDRFELVDLHWQTAFKLHSQPLVDRYVIHLVLDGVLYDRPCDRSPPTPAATAAIYNPGESIATLASERGQALLLAIDRSAVDATVSKLLARRIDRPTIFESNIDLTGDVGTSLKQFVKFLWESAIATAERSDNFSSLLLPKLEQTFLDCAIEGLPNNYTDELAYRNDGALACHVRKAQAYIEAHLSEKIELADIAAATQVCPRLLQKAFAIYCDRSPMRFVIEMRLQRVRQELERGNSDTKIIDVMMNYGLTQGGKFAKEYQQLFGEKPSETLKRSHRTRHHKSPFWHEIDDERSAQIKGGREYKSHSARLLPSLDNWWEHTSSLTPQLNKSSSG